MSQLIRYEAARTALAECQRVDEVKDIRDKAEAMAAYARQAKDTDMIQWATEIKVRAERKAGEMLALSEKNTGAAGVGPIAVEGYDRNTPKLRDIGITKDQSSRWQSLASMSEDHFETAVATAKDTAGQVTTAFMLREAAKHKTVARPQKGAKADAAREELKAAMGRPTSMIVSYTRLLIDEIHKQNEFTPQERELLTQLKCAINSI